MRRGIPFHFCLAALCAVPAVASSDEYQVRYDTRLERMILARVAARIGETRGALEQEWRPATVMDRLANLSAIDMSVVARRPAIPEGSDRTPDTVLQPRQALVVITSTAGTRHTAASATP